MLSQWQNAWNTRINFIAISHIFCQKIEWELNAVGKIMTKNVTHSTEQKTFDGILKKVMLVQCM